VAGAVALALALVPSPGSAETLLGALRRAYEYNPGLGAQEANLRATAENVPRARSGYLPRVAGLADGRLRFQTIVTDQGGRTSVAEADPLRVGVGVTQTLFDGGRTTNAVRQARSQVHGAEEIRRNTEHDVLYAAAVAYSDVLRDRAILKLDQSIATALQEQLRRTSASQTFGDVTRTDVAQAEARLAASQARVGATEANLRTSAASYREVIGAEPDRLGPAYPVDGLVPPSLDAAVRLALAEHPAIQAAAHNVDAARLQTEITRGELLPRVEAGGELVRRYGGLRPGDEEVDATIFGQVIVPIYSGGEVQARVRQAAQRAGQRRLEAASTQEQVRGAVASSWARLQAAKMQLKATQQQVGAASAALRGVRQEQLVGERTTTDVLDALQDYQNAWANLIAARRDRVVATFAVARATGRLSLGQVELPLKNRAGGARLAPDDDFTLELGKLASPLGPSLRPSLAAECVVNCPGPGSGWSLRTGLGPEDAGAGRPRKRSGKLPERRAKTAAAPAA